MENELSITKELSGTQLTIALNGRLDTITSPEFESLLRQSIPGVTELVLDLSNLAYISSAGLRTFLVAQKIMNAQGTMKLIHVGEAVYEILDITGFTDVYNIE